jgi:AcrR family transcriptional regulator
VTTSTRPGGRSARIQQAVHQAVRELRGQPSVQLTVPQIAQRAGVTPSTIYRRWGDLAELLADVAVERMRPDSEPVDTGSLRGDLLDWTEQYVEEMSTSQGRAMLRDVVGVGTAGGAACTCASFNRAQLQAILERARVRGEQVPELEAVVNAVLAPVLYCILFTQEELTSDVAPSLVENALRLPSFPG